MTITIPIWMLWVFIGLAVAGIVLDLILIRLRSQLAKEEKRTQSLIGEFREWLAARKDRGDQTLH